MKPRHFLTPPLLFFVILICALPADQAFAREEDSVRYVVTLLSSEQPVSPAITSAAGAKLTYVSSQRRKGKTLYRLRLGFFPSRKAAESILPQISEQYPSAWVTRVSKREKKSVMSGELSSQPMAIKTAVHHIGK